MPIVTRRITETVRQDIDAKMEEYCCDDLRKSLLQMASQIIGEGLLFHRHIANFCPFCGDRVVFDDTIIFPEGYKRIRQRD